MNNSRHLEILQNKLKETRKSIERYEAMEEEALAKAMYYKETGKVMDSARMYEQVETYHNMAAVRERDAYKIEVEISNILNDPDELAYVTKKEKQED